MPETSGPSALLSDYGGVLTTDVWQSFRSFCVERGLEPSAVRDLFRGDAQALSELRRLESGQLGAADFERRFAELLGTEPNGLIEGLFAGLEPDARMVGAIESARESGIRTALVSNSWVMDHYSEEVRSLFDAVVISGEVGLHKPQPEIFRLAARRVGEDPGRCVFVDDLRENCVAAEALGMSAVLHRSAEGTIARLEELFAIRLG